MPVLAKSFIFGETAGEEEVLRELPHAPTPTVSLQLSRFLEQVCVHVCPYAIKDRDFSLYNLKTMAASLGKAQCTMTMPATIASGG